MYMIIRQVRPVVADLDVVTMRMIFLCLLAALVVSGYVKINGGYYPSDVREAKKKALKLN